MFERCSTILRRQTAGLDFNQSWSKTPSNPQPRDSNEEEVEPINTAIDRSSTTKPNYTVVLGIEDG